MILSASTLFTLLFAMQVIAHGTVDDPVSRVLAIYNENPERPSSAAGRAAVAVAGGNHYYTWNQVSLNVANYASAEFDTSYASVIADGQIASAGVRSPLNFAGLDLVSDDWDWPATPMQAGPYVINWRATAPHDPSFFKIWLTKPTFNRKLPLAWSQFEFLGKVDVSKVTKEGLNYRVPITLPERSGRHVLYVAWQRIDPVGEVFFSASDVIFGSDSGPTVSTVASLPSTAAAGTTVGNGNADNTQVDAGATTTTTAATNVDAGKQDGAEKCSPGSAGCVCAAGTCENADLECVLFEGEKRCAFKQMLTDNDDSASASTIVLFTSTTLLFHISLMM